MVWVYNIYIVKGIIDEKLYFYVVGQFLKECLDNNYVIIGSIIMEGNFILYSEYNFFIGGKIIIDIIL